MLTSCKKMNENLISIIKRKKLFNFNVFFCNQSKCLSEIYFTEVANENKWIALLKKKLNDKFMNIELEFLYLKKIKHTSGCILTGIHQK